MLDSYTKAHRLTYHNFYQMEGFVSLQYLLHHFSYSGGAVNYSDVDIQLAHFHGGRSNAFVASHSIKVDLG